MKFAKMQGCGNDYVYINGFEEKIDPDKKPELVRKLSERHFGIGSDGVIFINPSDIADFEMEMYNADGSRSEMCGNGIRCVAKYVYDKKMIDKEKFNIESFRKIKYITIIEENKKAKLIKVGMGNPELSTEKIPAIYDSDTIIAKPIEIDSEMWEGTCVSMGNPHVVLFVDDVQGMDLETIGPKFENHPMFPNRANAEFVKVIDKETVEMRVWERGTGETLACGTGCCATAVACTLNGKTGNKVLVKVLGGEILVEWDRETNEVYMTGPGEFVFEGEILSI
ncbi:MAG: diaminopimelate epimerase [Lachnospiraceae bacterium]|nr:diaminopimelate epimerase [Lachnospiraceae bacterium]